jgi:SSS family solute:Na+ symporter
MMTPRAMMRGLLVVVLVIQSGSLAHSANPADAAPSSARPLEWEKLAPLPDHEGFAFPFAGLHRGVLLVAGGANFPGAKPWEGGEKVWHDSVFVLETPGGTWKSAGKLPGPLAYGVSITTKNGVICLGGSNADRHYADCFLMQWDGGKLKFSPLPSLPKSCANFTGALFGDTIYVAGGIETPDATTALRTFWSLDLSRSQAKWRELKPWPGPGRMLATMGVQSGSLFLLSGTALRPGDDGEPARQPLTDAYRFTPAAGWNRIADLPRAAVAAPTPAPAVGQSHLLVLGGDDGSQAATPPDQHRGFPRDILAYHTITNSWVTLGELSFSFATTPTVIWNSRIVVPGGEVRPGIRSNEIWAARTVPRRTPFGWLNYATLIAYLAGMVAVGWACAARNKNTEDYFRASGRIPWWAAGLSIYATMLSSVTFMAIPAKAYATDWTFLWANVPILLLAPVIIKYYLPFFRQLRAASAYEYLEKRFNLAARLYASTAFILFQLGRQAIVLLLPSLALATVSDLNVTTCIVVMGVLCVTYTTMGGIEAVIWTDVAQTIVLLSAAVASLLLIVATTEGGIGTFWSDALAADKFHMFNWTLDPTTAANAFWVILIGNLFINLVPYTSDQAVIQRYMTTKDEAKAGRAIWTNALLAVPSTALFFAVGTALFVFYRANPDRLDPTQATDSIFPAFIVQNLPVGLAGLVIAGIFAAAQSTVSSSLNSVVTAMMTDFYGRLGGSIEGPRGLRIARWLTALNGAFAVLAALVLAGLNIASLWDAYLNLVGLAGSGLAGLFALGIFTRRASGGGAIAGALASAVVLYLVQQHTRIHFFLYACIGFVTCFAVGWIVSVLLPRSEKLLDNLTIYDLRTDDQS